MIANYIRVAFRNILSNTSSLFLNVGGLALGLTCCLVVFSHVQYEYSFDDFHSTADRVVRMNRVEVEKSGATTTYATTASALAPTLLQDVPEVEAVARLNETSTPLLEVGQEAFYENKMLWADSTFFRVFDVEVVRGRAQDALNRPNAVVLTRPTARKYFGDANPLGKEVRLNRGRSMTVTAVVEEMPVNSHLTFNVLASQATFNEMRPGYIDSNWRVRSTYTYVLLNESADTESFVRTAEEAARPHLQDLGQRTGLEYRYTASLLPSIHLETGVEERLGEGENVQNIATGIIISVLILVLAVINFVNLLTARAIRRAKEIAVRKVLGGHRRQIVGQFMSETVFLALLGLVVAIPLAVAGVFIFRNFIEPGFGTSWLFSPLTLGSALGVTVLIGMAGGAYPAFVLSCYQPSDTLRGQASAGSHTNSRFRWVLVTLQFAASILLVIGTLVVSGQLDHLQEVNPGYAKSNVVVIDNPLPRNQRSSMPTLLDELGSVTGVQTASIGSQLPTKPLIPGPYPVRGEDASQSQTIPMALYFVNYDYLESLSIDVVEGRRFSRDVAADSMALLINREAARRFGWADPIGKTIYQGDSDQEVGEIIGVVEDFHYASLTEPVKPVVFLLGEPTNFTSNYVVVRTDASRGAPSVLPQIKDTWSSVVSGYPIDYFFLEDQYQSLYAEERQLGDIVQILASLAILIACFGLFGLSSYVVVQRMKEVCIRKIHGASTPTVLMLLLKRYLLLLLAATVVACPIGYVLAARWLDQFASQM